MSETSKTTRLRKRYSGLPTAEAQPDTTEGRTEPTRKFSSTTNGPFTDGELKNARQFLNFITENPEFKYRGQRLLSEQIKGDLTFISQLAYNDKGELEITEPIAEPHPVHWNIIDPTTVIWAWKSARNLVKKAHQYGIISNTEAEKETAYESTENGSEAESNVENNGPSDEMTGPTEPTESYPIRGRHPGLDPASSSQSSTAWSRNPTPGATEGISRQASQDQTDKHGHGSNIAPAENTTRENLRSSSSTGTVRVKPTDAGNTLDLSKFTPEQREMIIQLTQNFSPAQQASPTAKETTTTSPAPYTTSPPQSIPPTSSFPPVFPSPAYPWPIPPYPYYNPVYQPGFQQGFQAPPYYPYIPYPPQNQQKSYSSVPPPHPLSLQGIPHSLESHAPPGRYTTPAHPRKETTTPTPNPPQQNPGLAQHHNLIPEPTIPTHPVPVPDKQASNYQALINQTENSWAPTWKLKDLGLYWPNAKTTSAEEQIVHDKEQLIFRDIELWIHSVETNRGPWGSQRFTYTLTNLWQLLRGPAAVWYQQQLSPIEKARLSAGFDEWFAAIRKEFGIKLEDAQQWLDTAEFTEEDVKNGTSIRTFAGKLFEQARAYGDKTDLQLLTRLRSKLHPNLRMLCPKPTVRDERAAYVAIIDETRRELAEKLKHGSDQKTAYSYNNRREPRREKSYQVSHDMSSDSAEDSARSNKEEVNWQNSRRYRNRPRFENKQQGQRQAEEKRDKPWWKKKPSHELQNQREYRQNQRYRDRYQDKSDNKQHRDQRRKFTRARRYAKPIPGEASYVDDVYLHENDDDFEDAHEKLLAEGYVQIAQHIVSDYESDEHTHFIEVENEQSPNTPESTAFFVQPDDKVVEAVGRPDFGKGDEGHRTTFMKISIKFDTNGDELRVCADTGASTILVDKQWLKKHAKKVVWKTQPPKPVSGVKSRFQITESATFDFYIPGEVKGQKALAHFTVTADVMEDLKPNLLLGTRFLYEYGAKLDFLNPKITFRSARNMKTEAEVIHIRLAEDIPPPRKTVVSAQTVTIPPKGCTMIRAKWSKLPHEFGSIEPPTALHFDSTHPAAYSATVDPNTPKALLVSNNGTNPLIIQRNETLGHMGYTSEAMEATFATLPSAYTPPNIEFDEAACLGDIDASRQANEQSPEEDPVGVDHGIPNYGINRPDDIPYQENKFGVRVALRNNQDITGLIQLTDEFDIYRDRGVVPMPEEMKMRVNLVDGWQNQQKTIRKYPLGIEDRQVLNEVHEALHKAGKMDFMDLPTPIACPAFVVWRVVNGKRKGRVVVDLRPLNSITVPDAYPLPDQSDIMADARGKKFYSMFDATGFFFQLPIYGPHRDRMAVISDRGLEVSNVALMGFRNSPSFAQRFMDRIFHEHRHFVQVYIDDIIVFSDSLEEHIEHLRTILQILDENRIHISAEKSFIGYPAVKLLGFVVNGDGISKTDDRIEAFKKLAFPSNLAELETYIGMAGYLRTGIPWYDLRIKPLLLRKTQMVNEATKEEISLTGLSKPARKKRAQKLTFEATPEELNAFKDMQSFLTNNFFLWHHDPRQPLFFKLDACKNGFGLFVFQLAQEWDGSSIPGKDIPPSQLRPILFLSRLTSSVEKGYGSTEAEIAAVAWAIRKLRKMVQSNQQAVNIITDHAATKGILMHTSLVTMDLNKANLKLANIANYLSQFKLKIFHVPGTLNVVPDALSRLPVEEPIHREAQKSEFDELSADANFLAYLSMEAIMDPALKEAIIAGYATDKKYARIIESIQATKETDWKPRRPKRKAQLPIGPWILSEDNLLYHEDFQGISRLCIPSSAVQPLLTAAHDEKHHFGAKRMRAELALVQFRGMDRQIRTYIDHCPTCRENSTSRQRPPGELQPIKAIPQPFYTIAMDFITDMPEVAAEETYWKIPKHTKLDTLCTVNCPFSKKTMLLAGHSTYTAKDWATVLLRNLLLQDWGIPKRIISDRDPKFTSNIWKAIFDSLGTKLLMSAAYHPQTDGTSERKNQTVETAIRYHTATDPDTPWIDLLPSLQHNLNNAKSEVTGLSPNQLVYGFKPLSALDAFAESVKRKVRLDPEAIEISRQAGHQEVQHLLDIASTLSKIRYDKTHDPTDIQEGDTVYLRLHNGYHLPGKPKKKWSPTRAGPYTVIKKVHPQAFKLDFPRKWKVHPVVSAAQLWKPTQGKDPFNRTPPPAGPVEVEGSNEDNQWEVERIVKHTTSKRGKSTVTKYLVRWKNYTAKDDEWIAGKDLKETAPDLVREYNQKIGIN